MDDHTILGIFIGLQTFVIGLQTVGLIGFGIYMRHGFEDMHKTQLLIAKLVVPETETVESLLR